MIAYRPIKNVFPSVLYKVSGTFCKDRVSQMLDMCQRAKKITSNNAHHHRYSRQTSGYAWQGPGCSHPLARAFPPGVAAGPMGCGSRMGQGCLQNIIDSMNCHHGTYVDVCNVCQCAKGPHEGFSPFSDIQGLGHPVQRPGPSHPLMAASHFPSGVLVGPQRCGERIGQGCVQSIVDNMKCPHETYVDICNMCQCAKGPNETCGGAWGEHGRCTANLHCFNNNEPHSAGKCMSHVGV
ncbi:uncharacterized protein LOC119586617 [Penaeus monodon]|uniref:uncharacterized protein LOC119586617 n=1 Tax=Penaeus monodon TaxID=6687 RepID=UPI0018A71C36|nr:uncharacterized protein LOC119586617 [Penaeus monodon]